jgi:hypothetical protein
MECFTFFSNTPLVAFGIPIAVNANRGRTPYYADSLKRTRRRIPVSRVTPRYFFESSGHIMAQAHNDPNVRKGGTLCRNTV